MRVGSTQLDSTLALGVSFLPSAVFNGACYVAMLFALASSSSASSSSTLPSKSLFLSLSLSWERSAYLQFPKRGFGDCDVDRSRKKANGKIGLDWKERGSERRAAEGNERTGAGRGSVVHTCGFLTSFVAAWFFSLQRTLIALLDFETAVGHKIISIERFRYRCYD